MKKNRLTLIVCMISIYWNAQVQLYGLSIRGGTDELGTILPFDSATGVTTTDQPFICLTPGSGLKYADLINGGNNKFSCIANYGGPP